METITAVVRFRAVLPEAGPAFVDEIVVPLDGTPDSERAVTFAVSIARRLGSDVRLLTTKADLGDRSPTAYLEDVAAGIDMPVATEVVLDGPPAETIASATSSGRVGVCMATHARGRILGALHPNIAEAVVAAAVGPVFLIGPACVAGELGDGPVLVAHDGTEQATNAARPVIRLAAALDRPVEVVTVVVAPASERSEEQLDHQRAIQPLLDEATRLGIAAKRRSMFAKDVLDGLVDAVTDVAPSLVAMATHHRGGLDRLRQGSTTMAMVHDVGVPVIVGHLESHRAGRA